MKRSLVVFLCFCCGFLAWADLRYVEVSSVGSASKVRVEKIEDLQFLIKHHGIEIGYLLKGQDNSAGIELVVVGDGTQFFFNMNGYRSIDSYLAGSAGGFLNGADFQEAVELELTKASNPDSALYYFYRRNKFKSIADCKDAFQKGFAFLNGTGTPGSFGQRQNAAGTESAAYYKAQEAQLADYKEYQEFNPGLEKGFKTKADIQDAKKKGFGNVRGQEYYVAMERGFSQYTDYKTATDLGLASQAIYTTYTKVVAEVESIMKQQKLDKAKAFTYFYLCHIPKGQRAYAVLVQELEKIFSQQDKQLVQALDLYCSDIPSLTEWENSRRSSYSSQYRYKSVKTLVSSASLHEFFKTVDFSKIGKYEEATGIFTRTGSRFLQVVGKEKTATNSAAEVEKPVVSATGLQDWVVGGDLRDLKSIGGNTSQQAVIPVSQEYGSKREVLDWYTSLGQISTKTRDAIPASVIVEVVLGYKQADKTASTEITQRQIEIKDYLRRYFTDLTIEDLRPRNEEERRIEIRNAINDDVLKSSEIKDVRFLSLQVIAG